MLFTQLFLKLISIKSPVKKLFPLAKAKLFPRHWTIALNSRLPAPDLIISEVVLYIDASPLESFLTTLVSLVSLFFEQHIYCFYTDHINYIYYCL